MQRFPHGAWIRSRQPMKEAIARTLCAARPDPSYLQKAKTRTEEWIDSVIVRKKLCPFAIKPHREDLVRTVVSCASNLEDLLDDIAREAHNLCESQGNQRTAVTTLIVAPNPSLPFATDYLCQVRFSWDVMERLREMAFLPTEEDPKRGLQVVNFHPKGVKSAYSSGEATPEDYVHRAPHPTFHLLREKDLFDVVESGFGNPEDVPARNAKMLVHWGIDKCRKLWGV